MMLKILLPIRVFLNTPVSRVIAEAADGFFCLLPRHVDFAAALVPGIFIYREQKGAEQCLDFLAQIGLVVLLFWVGLESRLDLLRKQLKQAGLVWLGDVVVSGLVGFAVAFFLAGPGLAVKATGYHLSWDLEGYLTNLEQEIEGSWKGQARSAQESGAAPFFGPGPVPLRVPFSRASRVSGQ